MSTEQLNEEGHSKKRFQLREFLQNDTMTECNSLLKKSYMGMMNADDDYNSLFQVFQNLNT